MQQFSQDDEFCQDYAAGKVQGHVNRANDDAVRRGLIGTIIGAAVGGAVGTTRGAVVGGTAGAAIGSSSGQGYDQYGVQREYDLAYAQCMASRGNDVPGWYEHRSYHERHSRQDRDYDRGRNDHHDYDNDRDDHRDYDNDRDDHRDYDDNGPDDRDYGPPPGYDDNDD
jgi:hypothetical protein